MVSFENDYIQGCHPAILERFINTNMIPETGYGFDSFSESAKEKIRKAIGQDAEVFFLNGGTQTNMIVIDTMLKSYQGVVAADTGHVALHEAGAIEKAGHKVITVPQSEGKIDIDALKEYLTTFYNDDSYEHMTFPGMVYISHPTEYGTIYSKSELEKLRDVCDEYDMTLYLDGARLASGLMNDGTDVTISDIARLCDVFYIGGTKCGALCGEAVVFTKDNMPDRFLTLVKQRGGLTAKGRLLGIQFDTLFTDELYFRLGRYAVDRGREVKAILKEKGYRFYMETPTNQQFVILDNTKMKELSGKVGFSFWEKYDDSSTVVRFATSWATSEDDIRYLREVL